MLLALIKSLFEHMAAALVPCAPGSSFVTLSFSDVPVQPVQQPQEQAQPVQPSVNGQELQPQAVQPGGGGQPQPPPPPSKQLTVDRAVLWHASTVLRAMFEDTCSGGGGGGGRKGGGGGSSSPAAVLQLTGDRPEDWEVALRLLHTSGEALDLVTWDNVVPLCRLADKYDIARLRHDCAWFLTANVPKLTLTAPLASPQNLLHAASLVERYLHQVPHSTQPVREQLDSVIGQLVPHSNYWSSEQVATLWYGKLPALGLQLAQLAASAEYPDIVAPELQKRIQATTLAALTTVLNTCLRS